MKAAIVLVLSLLIWTPAYAGEIQGVVKAEAGPLTEGTRAVVWVEGPKAAAAPAEKLQLSQRDVRFSPTFMVVMVGQTVEMPNDDDIIHNVFSISPTKTFNLGLYSRGESRSVTFDKPGPVDLFCKIHRHMNAKIFVVPNPFFAVTEPGKPYVIKDVPPGRYKLHVWHEHLPAVERMVAVPQKGAVAAPFELASVDE